MTTKREQKLDFAKEIANQARKSALRASDEMLWAVRRLTKLGQHEAAMHIAKAAYGIKALLKSDEEVAAVEAKASRERELESRVDRLEASHREDARRVVEAIKAEFNRCPAPPTDR